MLILMLHWFWIATSYLKDLSSWVFWGLLGVLPLAYVGRTYIKRGFDWLMGQKKSLLVAAVLFQLFCLFSAELLIRRDAAVVFTGAFHYLKAESITNYLTRNPNNLWLFLYERWFYKLFGPAALWVLQGLNLFYADVTAYILYKGAKRFTSQRAADLVFSFYLLLMGFSPYFYSMYTDIWPLPLIALQIFLIFGLLEDVGKHSYLKKAGVLGLISALAFFIRPTVMILLLAFFALLFLKGNWWKFLGILLAFSLSFAPVYGLGKLVEERQQEVILLEGEGLAKGPLLFINLGLTYIGHDQEDMKEGLLQYVEPEERDEYNNGMFAKENVKKEIKRRLAEYSLLEFWDHLYYKHSLTVTEGTLGWLYRDADKEKTPYISPLYPATKKNPLAQFIRTYFLSTDKKEYRYYEIAKQLVWIVMSLGLVLATLFYRGDDKTNLLMLSVFGGLLFLLIFEGGKTRYLIQFLPQILLLASLGWAGLASRKENK